MYRLLQYQTDGIPSLAITCYYRTDPDTDGDCTGMAHTIPTGRSVMEFHRTSRFRRAVVVTFIPISIVLADSTFAAFFGLLILFGIWNAIVLFLVPRSRLAGGIFLLIVSSMVLGFGTDALWLAALGGILFVQANWLSFTAASRLDQ